MSTRQRALVRAPKARPAETTGAAGAVVTVIALALGAPAEAVGALGAVAAALPALVTWLVTHGGIRGVARAVWGGHRR